MPPQSPTNAPQLPAGYAWDTGQGGDTSGPKLPAGYTWDTGQPSQSMMQPPPSPPGYLEEALGASKRFISSVASMPKQSIQLMQPRGKVEQAVVENSPILGHIAVGATNLAGDLAGGFKQAGQAAYQAVRSGEGLPGATLAFYEHHPIVGPMVQHAVQGGPGYFNPQAVGAGLEGSLWAAAPEIPEMIRGVNKIVPSTTRAGVGLNLLTDTPEAAFAQRPVRAETAAETAADLLREKATVGEQVPPQVQHFMERYAGSDTQPITMYEARTMLKEVNSAIYDRSLPEPTRNALKRFAGSLDQDITAGAKEAGFGDDYLRMKNEYRRGSKIIRGGTALGTPLTSAAGYEAGRLIGGPVGGASGAVLGGMAGKAIGEPIAGTIVRSVIERKWGGPPDLRQLPAPPTTQLTTPPVATPIVTAPPTEPAPPLAEPSGRRVTQEQVAVERRTGVERRGDAAARARFEQMTPEERYQAAFTNKVTGLPNASALAVMPPAPAYGMSDVAGLKWLNDTHGTAAGDALLRAKADALREAGLEAYHTGGDEFKFRGDNPADLYNRLINANNALRSKILEFTDAKTGKVEHYSGAEFRHGVGPTPEAAEAGMLARKAAQKATRGTQGTLRKIPPSPAEAAQ